jgi:hypothetical protein
MAIRRGACNAVERRFGPDGDRRAHYIRKLCPQYRFARVIVGEATSSFTRSATYVRQISIRTAGRQQ